MQHLTQLPPLSLYVHIPWCVRKCPYCDFNSHENRQTMDEQAYIDALVADLTQELPAVWGRRLSSIFIGGGTPSLFSAQAIDSLLSQIRALIPFNGDIEITLEANPGTAEADKFKGFFQAGINRLSIGVQSFNDQHLHTLGRIHKANEALKAIKMAQEAGFERINVDLMHGLPEQTQAQAMQDLATAFDSGVSHLSWYQLTLEPNTLFYRHPPKLPADDALSDIQDAGEARLKDAGFNKYEISAYAKAPSLQSRHNLNYWQFGDYLGIGAGAHGKITLPAEQKIRRYSKKRHPKSYLDASQPYLDNQKTLAIEELPLEFFMNTMRLTQGVDQQLFFERTGLTPALINDNIEQAVFKELLDTTEGIYRPTPLGHKFLNDLLEMFMPENLSPRLRQSIDVLNLSN
ncbi:radical SAM family heme chaperone HemW [Pleionea sp. CnH1-48]|uniref:radical SAM family heme chaperone HemW n=1 Tax=Pleionea sp. CnH1-48 TaxID=2954494 RepID=UPI0020978815|nr:radical SAM family heme chaperone HemW [Pleionea sp. CnH1-48]MCO7225275.1 radical SAM family heme chaperone HemW [Pleionea sp. CnH1-48]